MREPCGDSGGRTSRPGRAGANVAGRILADARAAGVPRRDDAALAEASCGIDLGVRRPPLYRAVAEALAQVTGGRSTGGPRNASSASHAA